MRAAYVVRPRVRPADDDRHRSRCDRHADGGNIAVPVTHLGTVLTVR
jgi:hypothetical protein